MADPTLRDVLNAIAQVRAEMATKKELSGLEGRVNALEGRVDKRFDKVDKELSGLEGRVNALEGRVDRRFDKVDKELSALEGRVDKRFDKVDEALADLDADLDGHMEVHRVIEKDIATLKAKIRPTRSASRAPRRR